MRQVKMKFKKPWLWASLAFFLALIGCGGGGGGGGGGGSSADNVPPEIKKFSSGKAQYELFEDIAFSGKAHDNKGIEKTGIDIDDLADSDGDGNPENDRDLPSLNSTLKGGYPIPGKYKVTGWALDTSNNFGSLPIYPIVKPYSEFSEVQDEIGELSNYNEISTPSINYQDWLTKIYLKLSQQARDELDLIEEKLFNSADEEAENVCLALGNNLVYGVKILSPSAFRGFSEDYSGNYPVSQETFDEILDALFSVPHLPIEYGGLVNNGTVPDEKDIIGWIDINGDNVYQATGAFTWDGDEDFNIAGLKTQLGFYFVTIPPDNPETSIIEGYDPLHPDLNKMRIIIEGNVYNPVLPLLLPGFYIQDIMFP